MDAISGNRFESVETHPSSPPPASPYRLSALAERIINPKAEDGGYR